MRRHFSAVLKNSILDSRCRSRSRIENNILVASSTCSLTRSTTTNPMGRHRHQRCRHHRNRKQQQRLFVSYGSGHSKASNHYPSHRGSSQFLNLQNCYFSNAVERISNADEENFASPSSLNNSNSADQTSTQLTEDHLLLLQVWYRHNHGEVARIAKDAFDTTMIQNRKNFSKEGDGVAVVDDDIQQLFTATFTCPLTNERFEAGRFDGYFDIDNQNFYRRKKTAIQAVSAVVLRHKIQASNQSFGSRWNLLELYTQHFKIVPTNNQFKTKRQEFFGKIHGGIWWTACWTCPMTGRTYDAVDLPSEVVSDSMKMKEAGSIWYRRKTDSLRASSLHAIKSIDWDADLHVPEKKNLKNKSSIELEEPTDRKSKFDSLLYPLISVYEEQGRKDLDDTMEDAFVITGGSDSLNDESQNIWTASFLCPLTGERFDSGTIITSDATPSTQIDELIWYPDKEVAVQAAVQRAYDAFKYRNTGENDPRFCKEDPSEYTAETVDLSSTVVEESKSPDVKYDDLTKRHNDTFQQDEDDFIIEIIPQQINQYSSSLSGSSKTLESIAHAWIDSAEIQVGKESSPNEIGTFQNSSCELDKVIRRSTEWISRQGKQTKELFGDRTRFDIEGEVCNLKVANAILSSLAECHQGIPFDSEPIGVEECATAIIESLWSSNATKPDAQSYALYLKCLEGETPSDVAAKAQQIVEAMESGEEYNQRCLPKPTDAIYRSLNEVKSLVGLNLVLESSDVDSLDRKIHLSKLAAMAHDQSKFDIDVAKKIIDHMRILAERNNEPSLQPDIEIFNAPLRWSGGHQRSRLYSRAIPWDSYEEIYKDGFKSDSVSNVQHSQRVEEWIEIIEENASSNNSLAPNIETYESLIQSLVRCGNRDSLLRAEQVAKNIIAGEYPGVQPRIQSFYPILAAWTYSGCNQGPKKVESWIYLLQDLMPNLESRIPILAQLSFQRQTLNRLNESLETDTSGLENIIFDSTVKCSKLLQNEIDSYDESLISQLQSDVFVLVINAWRNAASVAILKEDLEETKNCFREIQKVGNKFDDLLVGLLEIRDSCGDKSQWLKLLNIASSVYGAQFVALRTMEKKVEKFESLPSNDCKSQTHLFSFEERIRRLEVFELLLRDNTDYTSDRTLVETIDPNLTSIFPTEGFVGEVLCTSWYHHFELILEFLATEGNDYPIGESDLVRLSMLVARVASSATTTLLPEEKDHIIEKVSNILENYCKNCPDKASVTSTVIQSLRKGSFASDWEKQNGKHSMEQAGETGIESHAGKGLDFINTEINANNRKVGRGRARRSHLNKGSHTHYKGSKRKMRGRARPRILNS